jgi:DDE superfamily endonuclease
MTPFIVILMLLIENEERSDDSERQRHDSRIPRCALVDPQASSWERLYTSQNDQALITITGFDHQAFRLLEVKFERYFNTCSPWSRDGRKLCMIKSHEKRGRPCKVNACLCIGLLLAYYHFRGPMYILQGWFGFTSGHLDTWLHFARLMVICILHNDSSRIQCPDDEKVEQYKEMIRNSHPSLHNVYCVGDGLKLNIQQPYDNDMQSCFYNGWYHSHCISNLFLFAPDGMIIACVLNAPGSIHNSTLADWGNIYPALREVYERSAGQCCMDSAFASVGHPSIIKSS